MKLTPHFTFDEVVVTTKDELKQVNRESLEQDVDAMDNVMDMLKDVMEPVRVFLGLPVIVSSFYRCPALNNAVGSQPTSQHPIGSGCDFTVAGMETKIAFEKIWKETTIQWGQLIHEIGKHSEWIHMGYPNGSHRGQVKRAVWKGQNMFYEELDNKVNFNDRGL